MLFRSAVNHPLQAFLVLIVIMLCISGPSCFIAWTKLRKRNLAPVLNANGWAINSSVLVNIPFGATLTSVAKYPKLELVDPEAGKEIRKARRRRNCWICLIVLLALGALYLTNCFKFMGLRSPFYKEVPAVEAEAPAAEAEAPAAEAEAPAAAEAPAE